MYIWYMLLGFIVHEVNDIICQVYFEIVSTTYYAGVQYGRILEDCTLCQSTGNVCTYLLMRTVKWLRAHA